MRVGKVGVAVAHGRVPMRVRMRLRSLVAAMRVPVVRIMHMPVLVLDRLVHVLVVMLFCKREPGAERGQDEGRAEDRRHRLAEQRNGQRRAEEGRAAEVRRGARGAQVA